MANQEVFGGKVRVTSLPALQPGGALHESNLKRLLLTQGELAQFHNGEPPMRYVAAVELKAGTCRGNHFHRHKKEWFYVLSGSLTMTVQDVETSAPVSLQLNTGDLAVISPGIAHAFHVAASGFAVECSPAAFDREDTFPFNLPRP